MPWFFLSPAIIPLVLLTIGPLIFLYWISMTNYELGQQIGSAHFIGLSNYIRLFSGRDREFWDSVRVTLELAFLATSLELIFGFAIAFLIHTTEKFRSLFVSAFMLPMVVTPVIVGLIWKLMLNSESGIINWILGHLFGVTPTWLGPDLSFVSVLIVEVWQWTPFVALILVSGLASLPEEPLEAAAIDGATRWQTLRYVVLPILQPIILFALLIRLIDELKIFDAIFIMTGGGPGSTTESLSVHSYRLGFVATGWIGRSSATAVVLALITVAASFYMISRLQRTYREK